MIRSDADHTGALLGGGRYRVKRLIGAGAMGQVYVASDADLGHDVAIKILHGRDAEELFLIKQEFRALADLHHPNLVSLYDLVIEPECPFFTMELVDGTDLVTHVRGDSAPGPASPESVARLRAAMPALLDGLEALHATGRLHRDVKPSNILVTRTGRVVLIDFGLATLPALTPVAEDASLSGTLAYMAPELLRFGTASVASDSYALAITVLQALTGEVPDPGALDGSAGRARSARMLAGVPADLARCLTALLHEDPAQRPDHGAVRALLQVTDAGNTPSFLPSTAALWQAPFVDRVESLAVQVAEVAVERAAYAARDLVLVDHAASASSISPAVACVRASRAK